MKNFVANGESLQITDAVDAVVGGQVYKIGSIIGVVVADAAAGVPFTVKIKGIFSDLPVTASTTLVVGDMVYWDATAGKVTKTASTNTFMGFAAAPCANTETTCTILLSH